MGHLDRSKQNPQGMLVTDGKVSKFLSNLIDELGYVKVPSLASGASLTHSFIHLALISLPFIMNHESYDFKSFLFATI
jgi:hypothetical protein